MLDKDDLQAIAELIHTEVSASEERMTAKIAASEERMRCYVDEKITGAIESSEQRMKTYIREQVIDETNRAIAYTESAVSPKLDAIKEELDLALARPRLKPERVERVEAGVDALKITIRRHAEEIEMLKKVQ